MSQEFGQCSADSSAPHVINRLLSGIRLVNGPVWRASDGFCTCLAVITIRLDSAETVD